MDGLKVFGYLFFLGLSIGLLILPIVLSIMLSIWFVFLFAATIPFSFLSKVVAEVIIESI